VKRFSDEIVKVKAEIKSSYALPHCFSYMSYCVFKRRIIFGGHLSAPATHFRIVPKSLERKNDRSYVISCRVVSRRVTVYNNQDSFK